MKLVGFVKNIDQNVILVLFKMNDQFFFIIFFRFDVIVMLD